MKKAHAVKIGIDMADIRTEEEDADECIATVYDSFLGEALEVAALFAAAPELLFSLQMQAHNYPLWQRKKATKLCWCRYLDFTVNPQCEDQSQCVLAHTVIAKATGKA